MSNKTKWAPNPPPEPVDTGSSTPQPKKRGRKRVKYYIRGETKTRNQISGDFALEMARGQWVMAIWFW